MAQRMIFFIAWILLVLNMLILSQQPIQVSLIQPESIIQQIQKEVWYPKILIGYRVRIYYAIFDSPQRQLFQHILQAQWKEQLPTGENKLLNLDFVEDNSMSNVFQTTKDWKNLPSTFFEQHRKYDFIVNLSISESEQYAKLRSLDIATGRLSPSHTIYFHTIQEMIQKSADIFLEMIGCEGYLIKNSEKVWVVIFRGVSNDLIQIPSLKIGSSFSIFQQNRRLADSALIIQSFHKLGNYYFATGEYRGTQTIVPGLKIAQIYFTGGTQKFRLVNQIQHPQSGFSVFASYQGFSTDNKDYVGTTTNNGEFYLTDQEKKPIFLSIAKSVEGITFAFFRKMIILQDSLLDSSIETIVVADQEIAEKEARELTPENVRKHKAQEAKRMLIIRLEQAKEHLQKKELPNALVAIRSAQQFLKDLPDDERLVLTRTLKDVEEVYERSIQQKKANEDLANCYELLEQMDSMVGNFEYNQAQAKLDEIKKRWPKEFYPDEFEKVTNREIRLSVLKQDSNTALGQARQYLAQIALKITPEEIDHTTLQKLYPHLKIMFSQGCMDEQKQYNDRELWLKIRLHLNELSQSLAQKSQEYLTAYNKATSVQQRTDMLDKHQKSYQCSKVIDEWLQQMH